MRSLLLLVLLSGTSAGQTLVVSNRGDNTIQLYDVEQRKPLGVYDVGVGAHEFAVSPDGRTVVGACYGSGPMHRVADQRLVVVDLESPAPPTLVDLGDNPRPNDLAFAGPGRLVVTSEVKERVLLLDTKTWEIEREVPFNVPGGHMLALSPDGKRAYVPSVHTGKVAIVDLSSDEPTDLQRISIPNGAPTSLAVGPAGRYAFAVCGPLKKVAMIDLETAEVVHDFATGAEPDALAVSPYVPQGE